MSCKQLVFLGVALLCLLVLTPSSLHAQGAVLSTGTVTGTVTDPSNAVVPKATVTLTDLSTKETRTTTTNDAGHYVFANVTPGTYDLKISKAGFSTAKFSQQQVTIGTVLTLNVALAVGTAVQTVEVKATTGAELQTMNATVGNTVTRITLESLPSLSRDVSTFLTLQPGVTPEGSVAGAVYDQNTFLLDGGQNTNDMDGSMNIYTPSQASDPTGGLVNFYFTGTGGVAAGGGGGPTGVLPTPADSIEEFKVNTTNQTADFNSSAGSQATMVTKRGTDSWHGTAYEYYLDNNFNANTWDNNASGTKRPSYHYSKFGAAVGGPLIPKKFLGGKTYFFGNYQGFRFPNSQTLERAVPGPGLRLGLISLGGTVYNLNPTPTTYPASAPHVGALVPGNTYPSAITQAACGGVSCDPRNLGISPTIQALWANLPQSNEPSCALARCDVANGNVLGFRGNLGLSQRDNFGVGRVDHDFTEKWHFMSSYRFYKLTRATTSQTLLSPTGLSAVSNRPQKPWFYAAGLTTNFTTNFTNDFHYSYLRNFWAWSDLGGAPQVAGLGGALEPFGESSTNVLAPYNVNTQSIRTRYWNGHDNMFRDDMSWLKGNHVFQWGGTYQHNWNAHQRTDNGGGINYFPTYLLGNGGVGAGGTSVSMTGMGFNFVPPGLSAGNTLRWDRDYAIVLGMPSVTQQAYTRSGPTLKLNPPLTPAMDESTIPYYNVYFTDSWHMKPSFTFTYGLAWTLEMPPVEKNGKQVELVDQANTLISTQNYIHSRAAAALQGVVYNPIIGFTLVGNSENGRKYPYNPYYGSFSPRISAAWNPSFDGGFWGSLFGHGNTVVRGGFSILYGRLNGVDLVLVPLLGTGLIQPVQCFGANRNGTCGPGNSINPNTAFRIGPTGAGFDGLVAPIPAAAPTLPQPDFVGINGIAAGAGEALDPNFKPNKSFQFDFTVQRQLGSKMTLEGGYIGRIIRNEYQPVQINAVPYMFTLGGQRFDKAYANLVMQYCGGNAGLAGGNCGGPAGNVAAVVTPQPFFETALGGPTSAYCTGFASCTAAVAANEGINGTGNLATASVWSLWSDLDNGAFIFPRTMMNTPIPGSPFGRQGQATSGVGVNTSIGYGSYNAFFLTLKTADWHGLTVLSNFTYGKALGTAAQVQATSEFTVVDPYRLSRDYGLQAWDRKFVYNAFFVYQPPVFKGQQGVLGRLLGGWTFAPIFTAGSGLPNEVSPGDNTNLLYGGGQAFGESDGSAFGAFENAVLLCPNNFGSSRHDHIPGSAKLGIGVNGFGSNQFTDPVAAFNCFRNPILGLDDGKNGGGGTTLRGLPYWNLDFSVRKTVHITERYSAEFQGVFTNLLNHNQLADPFNSLADGPDWGALESQVNTPREIEFGVRFRF